MLDPTKTIGKLKEQVHKEYVARKNFPTKWPNHGTPKVKHLYHQDDEIDKEIHTKEDQDLMNNEKVKTARSREMPVVISSEKLKKLLKICRCGRPRKIDVTDYCLQKAINPYLPQTKNAEDAEKLSKTFCVPPTTNSSFGWLQDKPTYHKLEQSMKYISPTYSMPGPRVSDAPYHTIFIG